MSTPTEPTDEQLIERCVDALGGDAQAFELLVARHQERILANCRYLSGSSTDYEDLAQEVFIKAFFALRRFERRAKFSTWLQRIKINHCLNFIDKQRRATLVSVDAPEMTGHPNLSTAPRAVENIASRQQRQRIDQVLDDLSENLRVPLVLRDFDGLAYAEIAEQLGLSLSAVKMRIRRGRQEFRRRFRGQQTTR